MTYFDSLNKDGEWAGIFEAICISILFNVEIVTLQAVKNGNEFKFEAT